MSIISRTGDLFYAYRFIKLLITPWKDTDAYKLGILDNDGNVIKKGRDLISNEEKSAYTVFHRLVFNIKRLLNKLPAGKTKLASWATALFLIKEKTNMSEKQIVEIFKKIEVDLNADIFESTWFMIDNQLQPGIYKLEQNVASPKTGEIIALKGTKVKVFEDTNPIDYMIGVPIYKVLHLKTKQEIYINPGEIIR